MAVQNFHVRIKPFDKARGQLRRRHVDGASGQLFREDIGWYRNIRPDVAERLRKVRTRSEDPSSALVFDVLTEEEAVVMYANEQAALDRAGRRTPQSAQDPERTGGPRRRHDLGAERAARMAAVTPDLTTRDVRPSSERAAKSDPDVDDPDLNTGDLGAPQVGAVGKKLKR